MLPLNLQRRDLQRVVLTSLLVGLLIIAAGLGVIAWATTSVDRLERGKEEALVERRLERSLEQLTEDVNSATIWDDSVRALAGRPDLEWLALNFGDYYADYMQHEATLIWNGAGELVYASRESETMQRADTTVFAAALRPLLTEVQRAARSPDRRQALGFEAVSNSAAVVRIGDGIWLFAASTVVPENASVHRPASDPVVLSGRPVAMVLDSMKADLAISDPRFLDAGKEDAVEASVPVRSMQGDLLGRLVWTPDKPGHSLLADAMPVAVLVLLTLIAGAVFLSVWTNRIARDFTDNEAALVEARDRAEAANTAKTRFLANMSHELRTPLNGVVGMAEVMAAGELSSAQRVRLNVLRSAAEQLTRLIEHLLLITRLERDEVAIASAPFDPAATIRAVVNDHRDAARAKGLTLSRTMDDLGTRIGDESHLRCVLAYLIDNAITYTRSGEVAVVGRVTPTGVRITVSDTGIGIPEDLKPHLFDMFVQGDDSLTKRYDGVGLGLAICHNLVQAMGGSISVQSDVGSGSLFAVDLPLPLTSPLAAAGGSLEAA